MIWINLYEVGNNVKLTRLELIGLLEFIDDLGEMENDYKFYTQLPIILGYFNLNIEKFNKLTPYLISWRLGRGQRKILIYRWM